MIWLAVISVAVGVAAAQDASGEPACNTFWVHINLTAPEPWAELEEQAEAACSDVKIVYRYPYEGEIPFRNRRQAYDGE